MSVMTDFDLSSLGITSQPEAVEPEAYTPPYNTETSPLDAGTYSAKLIGGPFKEAKKDGDILIPCGDGAIIASKVTSRKNNKTYLSAEFQVQVTDGTVKGRTAGTRAVFTRVNTMPESLIFSEVKKGREYANGFMDMLIAGGYRGSLLSNDDYINALLTLAGAETPIRVRLDWSAFSNPKSKEYVGTGETLRGQKNFPLDESGSPDPHATFGNGDNEHTVLARNDVKAFYPVRK